MIVIGMVVAMASVQAAAQEPLVQFVRRRSLIYTTEKIEVYEGGWNKEAGRSEYKVHFSWSWFQPDGDWKGGAWLDSRSCPAVRTVLGSLESLDMPKPQPWKRSPPMIDGIFYSLEAPTGYQEGKVTITSNEYSPLATWVDRSMAALMVCVPEADRIPFGRRSQRRSPANP